MLERRRPLLDEGAHAFLLVLGGEQGVEHPALEPQPFGERRLEGAVDASLAAKTAGAEEDAMVAAVFSASSTSSAAGTTRATSPARSASAASIMRPVSDSSIALALPTARVSRCVPPAPGMNAELDLRLAELGGVGGENEIAHHRQLAAAAEREARDRRDERLARARHSPSGR